MPRLKPADVGYSGTGVPDPETMASLQRGYGAKIYKSGTLSPEVMEKFNRLQTLATQEDENSRREAQDLARALAPHFSFKVDDVDWDQS
jgi:hypothetical protein